MSLNGTPKIPKNQIRSPSAMLQDEHCDDADAKRSKLVDENGDPINSGNPLPVDAIINLTATKPDESTIFNFNAAQANTEYSVVLPDKTEVFTIAVRSSKAIKLQYSFVNGESSTKFITVRPGVTRKISGLGFTGTKTIYFQLNSVEDGGTIVEIETWNS